MGNNKKKTNLVIIGAGPGGYAAAFMAADLGLNVTLIDPRENPGGVCLFEGCIPSKALLHAVKVKKEALEANDYGISFPDPKINREKLLGWKNDVVQKLTGGVGQLSQRRKIEYVKGVATFKSSDTIEIEKNDGEKETRKFDKAIIATGSNSTLLPGFDPGKEYIMTSKEALDLKDIPKKLLVIGAGYIGLEMGTVYAGLGSKVTIAELTPHVLPGVDRDLVKVFEKANRDLFEKIMLETKVAEVTDSKNKVKVTFETKDGKKNGEFDKILLAVGRKPFTENLGLENTSVKTSEKGFIEVDEQRKTRDDNIFAIGDVTGEPMLAHKAFHEGRVAAEVIAGKKSAYEPRAIPAVVFTDPEIAWTGMSEEEAKEAGKDFNVVKFPWGASGRAKTLNSSHGITKMIIEKETGRILGVGIAGKEAGELIGEGTLAVEMAAVASDVSLTIHSHPTLSETIMETADLFFGTATHMHKPLNKNKK